MALAVGNIIPSYCRLFLYVVDIKRTKSCDAHNQRTRGEEMADTTDQNEQLPDGMIVQLPKNLSVFAWDFSYIAPIYFPPATHVAQANQA